MEIKSFADVALKTEPAGTFTALIATFDKKDKAGDILRRGAFTNTIAQWQASGSRIPVIFSHAWKDPMQHIGDVDPADVQETPSGLTVSGRFYMDEANAAKVHTQLRRKALREWSFGYIVHQAKTLANGARELLNVELLELGPCLVGVGDTATLAVKSDDVKAALADHRRQLTDELLDPYRARLDVIRRRLQLERA